MKRRVYIWTTTMVFVAVALVHGLRVVLSWDLVLGDVFIPLWVSWLAVAMAAFLAFTGCRLNRTRRK
jgi:uncharacterized protein YacL